MKKIWLIGICIMMFVLVSGMVSASYCYRELKTTAIELYNTNPYITIYNTEKFVEETNNYKFYWDKRNICDYWDGFNGDCTERANLAVNLLNRNDIRAKAVHGWCDGDKHDWYEFNVDGEWLSYEPYKFELCTELDKKGDGIW